MTLVDWKKSHSHFSEQLDFFFQLENSMEFVLLKLYMCFVSVVFSHFLYNLAPDFFSIGIFERFAAPKPQKRLRAGGSHQSGMYKRPKNNGTGSICCKSKQ